MHHKTKFCKHDFESQNLASLAIFVSLATSCAYNKWTDKYFCGQPKNG